MSCDVYRCVLYYFGICSICVCWLDYVLMIVA